MSGKLNGAGNGALLEFSPLLALVDAFQVADAAAPPAVASGFLQASPGSSPFRLPW